MKRHILIFIFAILSFCNHEASAFWGSSSTDSASASGLDVAAGFDVNTITTLSGMVMTPPESKGQEQHTVMSVAATQGNVTVVLGPWWYWEKQNFTITKKQDLTITGSLAQGKDGVLYLFAQRIENRSNGETVTLRSESGTALWSRAGSGNKPGTRQFNGSGPRSGAGSRGGGIRGGRR
ncbi:MAG: hypothetical protein A2X83_03835 [Desulfuromonadales bacterium GWD2_54_10]|nr:MAG: hypothetical protein A2X83_03835 [Desulfuromonadales bacterium GWD2_54_10]